MDCLNAGANDLGGTLMNESISRAAGAEHGQEMPPEAMDEMISSLGRQRRYRNTLYGDGNSEQLTKAYGAAELKPVINRPARELKIAS